MAGGTRILVDGEGGGLVSEKWQERRAWLLMFNVTEKQKEVETREGLGRSSSRPLGALGRASECTV